MPIGDVKEETVRKWRAARLKAGPSSDPPFGPVTVAKAYRLLRAILNTAAKDKRIKENPCQIEGADKESSPERPVLSVAEVYQLADTITPRYRALVLLATECGGRTVDHLGGQAGEQRPQRRSPVGQAAEEQRRIRRFPVMSHLVHGDVGEPGRPQRLPEPRRLAQIRPRRRRRRREIRNYAGKRSTDQLRQPDPRQAPRGDPHAPARPQNPAQLPQPGQRVREEYQPERRGPQVKAFIFHVQCLAVHYLCPGVETFGSKAAAHPLHHPPGEVGRENLGPAPRCLHCHHAGAGRDIQQPKPGRADFRKETRSALDGVEGHPRTLSGPFPDASLATALHLSGLYRLTRVAYRWKNSACAQPWS